MFEYNVRRACRRTEVAICLVRCIHPQKGTMAAVNEMNPRATKLTHNEKKIVDQEPGAVITGENRASNFIKQIVEADLASGKHSEVVTRFPPEPNGFLHLGHAKSICLNFGLANTFNGRCHLRFDDTNPTKENQRYIDAIIEDVRWLGGNWGTHLYFASDYFDALYEMAETLIQKGLAYVDHQTEEQVRTNRGDVFTPGIDSPYRNRTVEENLQLFRDMRAGKFREGECILRAKIDMAHGNQHMRDPPMYRVRYHTHPKTGDKWCIYPIYDFAHGQSDSIERITHSICTLEFEDHRPLYEWFQENLGIYRTRQIEFARLNCTHVVMSKRKLVALVEEKFVKDWDDPRLPTVAGMRRRGYPAAALRDFCDRVGVAKRDCVIPYEMLETCVRDALHGVALRRHVVLNPVKVVITNYPDDRLEEILECPNHPTDSSLGTRKVNFGKELYIDRSDFMEEPSAKFFRLFPGNEVRLRYAYWIKCESVRKNPQTGEVEEIYCTYDPTTKGGNPPLDGRKVKGTIHWVSAKASEDVTIQMYDHLFLSNDASEIPEGKSCWQECVNPLSLQIIRNAKAEPDLAGKLPLACPPFAGERVKHPWRGGPWFQFERVGFFVRDLEDDGPHATYNLTVGLTDTFAAKTDETSREAQLKEQARIAREKAAAERAKKKADRELREAAKKAAKAQAV